MQLPPEVPPAQPMRLPPEVPPSPPCMARDVARGLCVSFSRWRKGGLRTPCRLRALCLGVVAPSPRAKGVCDAIEGHVTRGPVSFQAGSSQHPKFFKCLLGRGTLGGTVR